MSLNAYRVTKSDRIFIARLCRLQSLMITRPIYSVLKNRGRFISESLLIRARCVCVHTKRFMKIVILFLLFALKCDVYRPRYLIAYIHEHLTNYCILINRYL